MWTTPSVVSILARWLPSRTSSTISGWSPSASPTCCACVGVGATRSTQTAGVGSPRAAREAPPARRPLDLVEPSRPRRHEPDRAGLAGQRRPPPGRSTRTPSGITDPDVRGRGRVRGLEAIGVGSSGGPPSVASRRARSRRPAYASGCRPAAEGERRRDGHGGHRRRDEEQPDHDRRRLARRPVLERADDLRVAQRPVAQRLGDELQVGVGRRVDLGVRAGRSSSSRRPSGSPARPPSRASARPSRPPTPCRTRAGPPPRPPPSSAASPSARTRSRTPPARARRPRGWSRRPRRHRQQPGDAQHQPDQR